MGRSAGRISIDLSLGTAAMIVDMERAKSKFVDFGKNVEGVGNQFKQLGSHGVSSVQATSAALRVMEGGLQGNLRAAERFIANVVGLGPALQAIFPVVGAIAFGGLIVRLGEEVYKFFKKIEEAPAKTAAAFRGMNDSIALTNEELAVANDRLRNDILKLEGKPQNGLALSLDEARLAAMKLGDELDKDLERFHEMMVKQTPGLAERIGALIIGKDLGPGELAADKRATAVQAMVAADKGNPAAQIQVLRYELTAITNDTVAALTKYSNMKFKPAGTGQPEIDKLKEYFNYYQGEINRISGEVEKGNRTGKKGNLEADKAYLHSQEVALKEAYDRMLTDMGEFEELTADDKLQFRKNELREISQYGQKYKELQYELNNEIRRLNQESFKEADRERDKMEKSDREFQEKMYEQKTHWLRNTLEAGKEEFKRFGSPTENLAGGELPNIIGLPAAVRLKGTPIGQRLDLINAGYPTREVQAQNLHQEQEILNLMKQTNAPLGQQLAMREKILQMQIAQGIEEGKSVSALEEESAKLRVQQTLAKWKSEGMGGAAGGMADRMLGVPAALGGAIAGGIFNGGQHGENIGHQIQNALKNIGKEMMGQMFTKMIETMIANTIATEANTIWTMLLTVIPKPFGFAGGGSPPVGVPSWVGEKGPELFIPKESGYIVPNHMLTSSSAAPSISHSNRTSYGVHTNNFQIYGADNPREVARAVAEYLKSTSASFGPYSR